MRDKLLFLLKYYLFWIVFSWVAKIIFLIYQYKETATLTGHDYVMLFVKGFRMDLSFGGYVMLLACIVMAIGVFLSVKAVKRIFSCLTILLLAISSLVVVGDLELWLSHGCHPLVLLENTGRGNGFHPDKLGIAAFIALCYNGSSLLWVISSLGELFTSDG